MDVNSPKYQRLELMCRIFRAMEISNAGGMYVNIQGHPQTSDRAVKSLMQKGYAMIGLKPDDTYRQAWGDNRTMSIMTLTKSGKRYYKKYKHLIGEV